MDITALVSVLGGIIASGSYIVSRKPDAREWIDKIVPFQGWIGVVLLFWSVRNAFQLIGHFSISGLVLSALQFVVGFLLAYALLTKYIFKKNEEAYEKGQLVREKIIKYQIPAGLGLIVLGLLRFFNIF